jgi:hypothetical protein
MFSWKPSRSTTLAADDPPPEPDEPQPAATNVAAATAAAARAFRMIQPFPIAYVDIKTLHYPLGLFERSPENFGRFAMPAIRSRYAGQLT